MNIEKHLYGSQTKKKGTKWDQYPIFSFRMPEELCKRMRKQNCRISWASYLREAVEAALKELEAKDK